MADKKRMGFEGIILTGVAGATGATPVANTRDITLTFDVEKAETTSRKTTGAMPIKAERAVCVGLGFSMNMLNKDNDANVTAFFAAMKAGTPLAFRFKDKTTGKGPDADFTISITHGLPLKGEQTFDVEGTLSDEEGREGDFWV